MACLSLTSWQQSERTPALVAHPLAASLDEAHAAIELWEYYSRKTLDAEQRLAVELMMAEAEDGRWAADTTGRAESRQNGKGDEIEVVELWGILQRSEAILHTAHEAATAASAHGRLIGLVEGHKDLRVKIKKKQSWNGNYSLALTNDGLIVWRTRTGAGGRGLDDISRIVVDEAQHAQPEELASSLPILSVNPNPQKNFIGSGGISGKSSFWWRQRRRALTGTPGRFSWLEHSAEIVTVDADGRIVTAVGDVADPQTWMRANPAYPSRISHDFLLDQLETLGPALFAREHLCVWDPDPTALGGGAIAPELWNTLVSPAPPWGSSITFSLDVAPDHSTASIAAAWATAEGTTWVQLADHRPGVEWVPTRVTDLLGKYGGRVLVEQTGTAGFLLPRLTATSVPRRFFVDACSTLDAAVQARTIRHGNQPELNAAVSVARWSSSGEAGQRVLSRKNSQVSPLVAVALAVHGTSTTTSGGWVMAL